MLRLGGPTLYKFDSNNKIKGQTYRRSRRYTLKGPQTATKIDGWVEIEASTFISDGHASLRHIKLGSFSLTFLLIVWLAPLLLNFL